MALLALAINLALSFGHIHLERFRGGQASAGMLLSAVFHHKNGQTDGHDGHPDDLCPICMAQAALGTGLAAAAPILLADFSYFTLDPIFSAEHSISQRLRTGFRSRGPPLASDRWVAA